MYMFTYEYAYMHVCGYVDMYGYDCLYMHLINTHLYKILCLKRIHLYLLYMSVY